MNAPKQDHASASPRAGKAKASQSAISIMVLYAGMLGAVLFFFWGLSTVLRSFSADTLVLPDEKVAAARLLAKQLSGPRYFEVPAGDMRDVDGVTVPSSPEPHITVVAARSQVERIAKERHLDAEGTARVESLIQSLTETPSSRLIGSDHINLLRLNLALDELK